MSDTKEFIIDEAFNLFLSRSYEAVSISDISNAIGFTKGALYHHFKNKEDLFRAVIDKYLRITPMDNIQKDISLAKYIQETIKHSSNSVKNFIIDRPLFVSINYFSLIIDAFRHYPKFADDKFNMFDSEVEKIKFVLDNAVKSGEIRNDIDTSVNALNYFSISIGIASNLFVNSSPQLAIDKLKLQLEEFYKILK